ncbi:MAG: electron transfer flavoprotein subunit alpha/FixB family protein [Chloroflexota bacterium]
MSSLSGNGSGNGVLIVAEMLEGALAPASAELAGIGRAIADQLGGLLTAVLLGSGVGEAGQTLATLGVNRVLVADSPTLASYVSDAYLDVLAPIVTDVAPAALLLLHSANMRELSARLAVRLDTALTTDCTGLRVEDGRLVMRKPVFGGSAIAEYVVNSTPQMATIRMRAFPAAEPGAAGEVAAVNVEAGGSARVTLVETKRAEVSGGPRLKDAKIVVSGGRGLGGPDNWHYISDLADSMGAAQGATRAVTDAGWVAPGMQVGLTGVTIAPDLYVTVAVSGAVQHIAGCSGSRNIVAINKDPDANIFKHARFGIVGDYKEVLPALTRRVKELRA